MVWEWPWGVVSAWTTIGGVETYRLEQSELGQPFGGPTDIFAGAPPPAAGLPKRHYSNQLRPGLHYQFRVTALAPDGSVVATSATVGLDAPSQYPQIANLRATVGQLHMAQLSFDGTTKPARAVTWFFDPIPGRTNALATWDRISIDPATNQATTWRWGQSFYFPSGWSLTIEAGTTVRICLANPLNDPFLGTPVAAPVCLDTPVPGGTILPATGTPASGGTVLSRPPTATGGSPTILSDATPPVVTTSPVPAGIKISHNSVPGATQYTVCRQAQAGGTCAPVTLGAAVAGSVVSHWDLGLSPGSSHTYQVRAWRADGHFGQSAPVAGVAGPVPTPQNFKIWTQRTGLGGTTLIWNPVDYEDAAGSHPVQTYQVSGGTGPTKTLTGVAQVVVPFVASSPYRWQLTAMLPDGAGGWFASAPAVLDYVPPDRYRLVALGVRVYSSTADNRLNYDGAEDEMYLASLVNVSDRALSSNTVTLSKSATFGDISGFPNRVQAGSATQSGGLVGMDVFPPALDIMAPAMPSPGFPIVLWEGPVQDQTMIVVHPIIWEPDKGFDPYLGWVTKLSTFAKSGYAGASATRQSVLTLRDAGTLAPGSGDEVVHCITDALQRQITSVCVPGEDRPVGLTSKPDGTNYAFNDRFLVLTKTSIAQSLLRPPSTQSRLSQSGFDSSGPGVVVVSYRDSEKKHPFGYGVYELYLRVEKVP